MAFQEMLRLLVSIWNPANPAIGNVKCEGIIGSCTPALVDCQSSSWLEAVKRRQSTSDVYDLSVISGVSWSDLVKRCVEVGRLTSINLVDRIDQLRLITGFLQTGLVFPSARATRVQREVTSLFSQHGGLDLLANLLGFASNTPPWSGDLSVRLILQNMWCRIMREGVIHDVPDAAVKTVFTNIFHTTAGWSVLDTSKLGQEVRDPQNCEFVYQWSFSLLPSAPLTCSDIADTFNEGIQDCFTLLRSHPDLRNYVKGAIDLTKARQDVEKLGNAPRDVLRTWRDLENEVLSKFVNMGERVNSVPRCGDKSCGRAWTIGGAALKACSLCRTVEYCSVACQKS